MTDLMQNCSNSRPGPKPDEHRRLLRSLFPEWSERTFATYYKAYCQLTMLDRFNGADSTAEGSCFREAIMAVRRPNGTLNVTRLAEIAEAKAAFWILDNCTEDGQ